MTDTYIGDIDIKIVYIYGTPITNFKMSYRLLITFSEKNQAKYIFFCFTVNAIQAIACIFFLEKQNIN